MNTRRKLLITTSVGLLLGQRLKLAQSAEKLRRVGILGLGSMKSGRAIFEAFKKGMRDRGWQEGRDVKYQFVFAGGNMTVLGQLAVELVRQEPEVILVANPESVRAVQQASQTIPIVMGNVSNAVGNGFINSLAKPGGNITGITSQLSELLSPLISFLNQVSPKARRLAVLLNETNPSHGLFWVEAQRACAALDLVPVRIAANAPDQLQKAVDEIVRQRAQAVVVVADGMYISLRDRLQELMVATRLPVVYQLRQNVDAGGLLSYSSSINANYRHAAKFVDKILKGANPALLPVEQPTAFELVVNLKTAKTLGITIPQAVLLRADVVIE